MTPTKKHNVAELERLYTESEEIDAEIFAEMRSNLLLISGEHYNRRHSTFFRRIRDARELGDQAKIRLTKNHVQNIHKKYVNHVVSAVPGVTCGPKIESELPCQKAAELYNAVWKDAEEKHGVDELIDSWTEDYFGVGEVHTKIFWDHMAGQLLGHRQAMDEEGNLLTEEDGSPTLGEAVYTGDFVIEELYGFNLLRAPEAKTLKKSHYLIIRKMVNKDDLLAKFTDKKKFIHEGSDKTMVVFDASKGGYRKTNNEVLLKEIYFRSCPQYPNGYYYFFTTEGILTEGELPGGVFPIVSELCEKIQTTPRGRSIIKHMRPYQAEINRAASKMAEHQITLGDDKILIQNGTKVTPGAALPGVRSINVAGVNPTILPGRDGSQYLNYMNSQIQELYQVMNCDDSDDASAQLDAYTLLYRSASQKKKFKRYIKPFERYLKSFATTYLKLAKIHLPDDAFIRAAGRQERINISEFKNADDLSHKIIVIPQSDDIETKMGKQLVLNHLVQFTGQNMDKKDLGKLIRLMPYVNEEEGLEDLTIDYDAATNMVLAMDRGEQPLVSQYDDPVYMIRRLTNRVRKADFRFMAPQIQMMYAQTIKQYQQIKIQQLQALQMAEAGFIPTDGYMVVCDLYVSDPEDPAKTRRARIPYGAIRWLIQKLETQGQSLPELEQMNQGALAEMAGQMSQHQQLSSAQGMSPRAIPQRG